MLRAGGVVIVDDAYNASPASVTAALELLAGLPGRHVAVLGAMRELGTAHDAGHRRGRRGRRPRRSTGWSWSTAAPMARRPGSSQGALAAGLARDAVTVVADPAAAVDALRGELVAGRRRARQGVARHRARAGRRRPGRGARRRGAGPVTLELIQGLLLAFALVVILMPPYIRLLRHFRFGKQIREEGPQSHMIKWGTPTMGGLLIILVVLGHLPRCSAGRVQGGVIAPIATLALVGLLGAVDDYLNARTGEGIRARQKLLWQTVVALFVAWQIQSTYQITGIRVPFVGDVVVDPLALRRVRRVRDRRRVERRQHHRRPRRAVGRHARVRVRVVHDHRAAQRPGPAATSRSCAR